MKPCVKCCSKDLKRFRAGVEKQFCIIQCEKCGFNQTGSSFELCEKEWNGFKVWDLVKKS